MDNKKCICCLKTHEHLVYLSQKAKCADLDLDYGKMLMLLTSFDINNLCQEVNVICGDCLVSLNDAFTFKVMCEKSFEELQTLETIKEEEIESANIENEEINETTVFTCELCNKEFDNYDDYIMDLTKHGKQDKKSGNLEEKYVCYLCGKKFKHKHGFKYHIQTHKGVKQYKCVVDNCGMSFICKNALNKHIQVHSDVKKFLCNECGKSYKTNDALSYHLKTHNEKRFKCTECDKSFLQTCHLKQHMQMHLGMKPFVCDSCGRAYSSKYCLNKHFRKYCGKGVEPVFKFRKVYKFEVT